MGQRKGERGKKKIGLSNQTLVREPPIICYIYGNFARTLGGRGGTPASPGLLCLGQA